VALVRLVEAVTGRDYFPETVVEPTLILLDVGLLTQPGPDAPTAVDLVRAAVEREVTP
jgi:hypothetical protein